MCSHHITAAITLSEDVPQPKTAGVKSGYAPHHLFSNVDYLVSGFHTYDDELVHYPGETLLAKIVFPSWGYFGKDVYVGDGFEVREMDRVVGTGIVQSINK